MRPHRYNDPYYFVPVDVGIKNAYLACNRDYKPLGVRNKTHIDYDAYAREHGFTVFKKDISDEAFVVNKGKNGSFWIYNDHPETHHNYLKTLKKVYSYERSYAR